MDERTQKKERDKARYGRNVRRNVWKGVGERNR